MLKLKITTDVQFSLDNIKLREIPNKDGYTLNVTQKDNYIIIEADGPDTRHSLFHYVKRITVPLENYFSHNNIKIIDIHCYFVQYNSFSFDDCLNKVERTTSYMGHLKSLDVLSKMIINTWR